MADQVDAVKVLTSRNALITEPDDNGQTPLHFAALNVSRLTYTHSYINDSL